MKKLVVCIACLLLFCSGLFALHLYAQSAKTETSAKAKVSLFDPKMEKSSERELLELKVESYRKILDVVNLHREAGMEQGGSHHVADARVNLAQAEAELFRHTGERDKLLAVLKTKVDTLRNKLKFVTSGYELGNVFFAADVYATEIQLLDALLEQKRTQESKL